MATATPKAQLDGFLDKFEPALAKSTRGVLARMRILCPGAHELVYDNYNALAIAFAGSETMADIVFSIAVYPQWASLFFARGTTLKDPKGLLQGEGSKVRHIVLKDGAKTLDEPGVAALIAQAQKAAGNPFTGGRGKIVIRSISAKQRPRRPVKK